jgi:hypothetical protein
MTAMHPNHFISSLLNWVAFAALFVFFSDNAVTHRKAQTLADGSVAFAPSKRSLLARFVLVAYTIYASIDQLTHAHRRPFSVESGLTMGIMAVTLLFQSPKTIVVTPDGIEQIPRFGKIRRIRWMEIAEINTGEKSKIVTITGADGTKIVHTPVLPDRTRLLIELKHHCGKNLPSDFPRETLPTSEQA